MQIAKGNNSLMVQLLIELIEEFGLKESEEIQATVEGRDKTQVEAKPGVEEFLAILAKYSGRIPLNFRFDRDDASAR